MTPIMKAGTIVEPMNVKILDHPLPTVTDDQVLIRVNYTGICGTDLKIYDGSIPYAKQGLLTYPMIPGHEWSGEVVSVGNKVQRVGIGERVTGECHIGCGTCDYCLNGRTNICPKRTRVGILGCDGGFAQYIRIPEKAVHRLPAEVSDQEGALVEPLTIALHALDKMESVYGSVILVFGLGPIGLLVCQVAKALGAAKVIGVDVDESRLLFGKKCGCDHVTSLSGSRLQKLIMDLTSGYGIDIVVEAAGVNRLLPLALELARPGGQVSLLGLYNGNVEINPIEIISKDLKIYGNMASARIWDRAIKLIESKKVDVLSIVTHIYPFEKLEKALETAYQRVDGALKVLINMNGDEGHQRSNSS